MRVGAGEVAAEGSAASAQAVNMMSANNNPSIFLTKNLL
jgi:hypothetical protein